MKKIISLLVFAFSSVYSQETVLIPGSSLFSKLKVGDSLTFYQCHVENAVQQLTTASGQTMTGRSQACTITEKYVCIKTNEGYQVNYYTTALNVFPNKKFSGLKIRERPYWSFMRSKSFPLRAEDMKVFLALEKKGREAIEFDYGITKYTTNQIIIKHKKDFKQLVIEGDYVISKLIMM